MNRYDEGGRFSGAAPVDAPSCVSVGVELDPEAVGVCGVWVVADGWAIWSRMSRNAREARRELSRFRGTALELAWRGVVVLASPAPVVAPDGSAELEGPT